MCAWELRIAPSRLDKRGKEKKTHAECVFVRARAQAHISDVKENRKAKKIVELI